MNLRLNKGGSRGDKIWDQILSSFETLNSRSLLPQPQKCWDSSLVLQASQGQCCELSPFQMSPSLFLPYWKRITGKWRFTKDREAKRNKCSFLFILYVWVFRLHVCLCTTCLPSAHTGQKRVSGAVRLEWHTVVSCHPSAGG